MTAITDFLQLHPLLTQILTLVYLAIILYVSYRIIMDTTQSSKGFAYLLLIYGFPIIGIIIYFSFGINYRRNKFFDFKIPHNREIYKRIQAFIEKSHQSVLEQNPEKLLKYRNTFDYLYHATQSPLSSENKVELLINGEKKFPAVLNSLRNARHHIHLEYYIFDNSPIAQEVADVLMQKAKEGIIVRLLYDDLGSKNISKGIKQRLEAAGAEVSYFNKVNFRLLANRANYRDHRKIIIIDGKEVYTGGINVSQRYINDDNRKLYWRDTHIKITGPATFFYQYLFLSNWMFTNEKVVKLSQDYFKYEENADRTQIVQAAASGPDTDPHILQSTTSAIHAARKRIYCTTPYLIPPATLHNALIHMAKAGCDVRIIVPEEGDSTFVNAAAYSYYGDLLAAGVRIFLYQRGFIHAKTMLIDDDFSTVGTANLDVRSQQVNFEVNTLIYDRKFNQDLEKAFMKDLTSCRELDFKQWMLRPKYKQFWEQLCRLFSPIL